MKSTVRVFHDPSTPVGELVFVADRGKQACQFAYDKSWLESPDRFQIDPALPLSPGHHFAQGSKLTPFFGCFADCEPDGWGRNVIQRDRRKRGLASAASALDLLLEVHDSSRVGALRFSADDGKTFLGDPGPGKRKAPPLLELKDLVRAAAAVDEDSETAKDLRLLLERGSPLGGMRPKCTIVDDDKSLALGKFPSGTDQRDIVRGEVLALKLATLAGINAAGARVVLADRKPVAVIRRFDREGDKRLMYLSARSFIGATFEDDGGRTYADLVVQLREDGNAPVKDIEEIWRRIVFSVLITNVDDHLNNHGFLHVAHGQWRLAPAFDVNPAPDKRRELKTAITEDSGNAATTEAALSAINAFGIKPARARQILGEVDKAVSRWKDVAASRDVGMAGADIRKYADAFEHEERAAARKAMAAR